MYDNCMHLLNFNISFWILYFQFQFLVTGFLEQCLLNITALIVHIRQIDLLTLKLINELILEKNLINVKFAQNLLEISQILTNTYGVMHGMLILLSLFKKYMMLLIESFISEIPQLTNIQKWINIDILKVNYRHFGCCKTRLK